MITAEELSKLQEFVPYAQKHPHASKGYVVGMRRKTARDELDERDVYLSKHQVIEFIQSRAAGVQGAGDMVAQWRTRADELSENDPMSRRHAMTLRQCAADLAERLATPQPPNTIRVDVEQIGSCELDVRDGVAYMPAVTVQDIVSKSCLKAQPPKDAGAVLVDAGFFDKPAIPEQLTTSPERVQIPAESEPVAHDDWFCEQHPWEVMGHDGCDGAGMLDCARWPMAQHIIRMRDQEIRELHQQYGFLAERALGEVDTAEHEHAAPFDRCPTCTAHMPVGKHCGGKDCGIRRKDATE